MIYKYEQSVVVKEIESRLKTSIDEVCYIAVIVSVFSLDIINTNCSDCSSV